MHIDNLKRQTLPPSFKNLLAKHGDEVITKIDIVRQPLASWTVLLLNILSLGEFDRVKDNNNYNHYFHLKLNISTDKHNTFTLEKNEVLNFQKGITIGKDAEVMHINNIPPNLILYELIENAKKRQGKKFTNYEVSKNNCQVFVKDVLQSNNMNNAEYIDFTVQDTRSLFEHNLYLRKITNTVTDIGAIVDNVINGAGIYDFDTLLTNFDLEDLAHMLNIQLFKVMPKNLLKGPLKNGNYILNLENAGQSGSHWVAFVKNKKNVYYFDSFGVYPVQELVNICKKHKYSIDYNMTQIQNIKSFLCGYYCIAFLHYLKYSPGNDILQKCQDFDDMFDHNTNKNDGILKKYISKYIKNAKR